MSNEIIDASCLMNLFVSGRLESILASSETPHFVSKHVETESMSIYQPDQNDPATQMSLPIDLANVMNAGPITRCDLDNNEETRLFVEFAAQIDDGELTSTGGSISTSDRRSVTKNTFRHFAITQNQAATARRSCRRRWRCEPAQTAGPTGDSGTP